MPTALVTQLSCQRKESELAGSDLPGIGIAVDTDIDTSIGGGVGEVTASSVINPVLLCDLIPVSPARQTWYWHS